MSLVILFHFLCAQHVSDLNISIIRSLRLCCWITTWVVLFSVRCVLELWCGWFWVVFVLQAEACKLLMMDILMSETCWAHKKWNKITSDIKLFFHSSIIKLSWKWTFRHQTVLPSCHLLHFVFFCSLSADAWPAWHVTIMTHLRHKRLASLLPSVPQCLLSLDHADGIHTCTSSLAA
jgi:hypothetical protein